MIQQYKTKPSDLLKVWAMPKDTAGKQFTLRVPAITFRKIKALESMFPGRTRNQLVSDLLATAFDEFEESLPVRVVEDTSRVLDYEEDGSPIFESYEVGPRADFRELYSGSGADSDDGADSESVADSEEVAA